MPSLLVIRLHPVEPISGADFTSYLNGLSIEAHDVSFNVPDGSAPTFGIATYIAPTLPSSPSPDPDPVHAPNNRITQHFSRTLTSPPPSTPRLFALSFSAIATAVIEIPDPPAGGEYRTADVRLVITRNGSAIAHKPIYYNVPVAPAPIPADPNAFPGLQPISLHLALPSSAQPSPALILPEDGTAPNFTTLRTAVAAVLNADPGTTTGIANLHRASSI
jgi:hypothetical protein